MSLANVVVIGAQWGDEGKGKITDLLSRSADVVVRYQGGVNAGHTIVVDDRVLKLHLIPSGILYPDTICLIGSGTVVDPKVMLGELDMLATYSIDISGLKLASTAHVTMPYHRLLDQAMEQRRGDRRIGTTGRGIGPTYADKSERNGIRILDILDGDRLRDRLAGPLAEKNEILDKLYGLEPLDFETVVAEYVGYGKRLAPHVVDCTRTIHSAARARQNILFEGAQGTLLDLDHGTYPYVTSSNPVSGGACIGAGVGPTLIDRVIGVAKAYTTRVGSGPFPTENEGFSEKLHALGREFGATTGRPRGCGWLDLVLLRYSAIVSGMDELAVTNLDGLDDFASIPVCVAYEIDGQRLETPPVRIEDWERIKPVYEEWDGWQQDISAVRNWNDLPVNAQKYLDRLSAALELPIKMAGVGPARSQTLVR